MDVIREESKIRCCQEQYWIGAWNVRSIVNSEVAQSCPTLCDPMDCSLPGSSVHGIFQAIVLEWIAISFSRGSSQSRDQTRVSRIVNRHFTVCATRDVLNQGKLEAVKQEMARVNINILGISELKWTGMGEFNSDDHYIYY